MSELRQVKRSATDSYLKKIWEEEIEPKINNKVMQGKSVLKVKGFHSHHSSKMLVNIGKLYGYEVEIVSTFIWAKWRILIKW